jgi:hypothetical protein
VLERFRAEHGDKPAPQSATVERLVAAGCSETPGH